MNGVRFVYQRQEEEVLANVEMIGILDLEIIRVRAKEECFYTLKIKVTECYFSFVKIVLKYEDEPIENSNEEEHENQVQTVHLLLVRFDIHREQRRLVRMRWKV